MLTYNHNIITHNDKWFNEYIGHPEPVYHVYTSGQGGQVIATPNSGKYGTYVTLSNTPSVGYEFESYSITGAPWYNRESFFMQHNDAYVEGHFNTPVRTVTCSGDHGTVVATPNSGIIGDTITLSNTPDEGYYFDSYSLTGATLYDGNKFDIYNSDVNVVGTFNSYNPLNLPANTIRVRTNDGNPPSKDTYSTYQTATLVPGTTDVYDVYKSGTSFERLFFNQNIIKNNIIEVLGANTNGITNMSNMFKGCYYLTSTVLFDTSSVTTMDSMFQACARLPSVPLFDTHNVTNMALMFSGCELLTTIPLFNTSKVTNMNYMFINCHSLTSIPLLDTSSVTTMSSTFCGCSAMTSFPLFDTHNVTRMKSMFEGCTSITSIPLFDTSNLINMDYMFSGCHSLKSIPLFNTSKVGVMTLAFEYCWNVETGALALYQQASTQTTPPGNHGGVFYECGRDTVTGAAELAQIPSSWGGTAS